MQGAKYVRSRNRKLAAKRVSCGVCSERATRLQYYLQLRDNLLHYSQSVSEEKCFLLAGLALQADFGPFNEDRHAGAYFDPRELFPAWVSCSLLVTCQVICALPLMRDTLILFLEIIMAQSPDIEFSVLVTSLICLVGQLSLSMGNTCEPMEALSGIIWRPTS